MVYGAADEKNGYRKYYKCPPASGGHFSCPTIPFIPKTELVDGIMSDECGLLMKKFSEPGDNIV